MEGEAVLDRRQVGRNVVMTAASKALVPETKGKHLEDIQAVFEQRVAKHRPG